jgi:peptidoglycan/xylan/chitin deacetylase (PgdA/CDA1 family)
MDPAGQPADDAPRGRHGSTRRELLVRSGVAAAGLAAGAAGGALLVRGDDDAHTAATAAVERRFLEAGGAADEGEDVARLGTHRVVWSTTVTEPVAAITFDDGPTPEFTPRILDALATAGVTATFNVMGHNGIAHPDLLREVVAAGHEIGNHTWSHRDLTSLTADETREEIERCRREVEDLLQQPFTSFRPPRGEITGYALRVAAEIGYDVYVWSCTRGPGDSTSVDHITDYIGTTVQPGDVLGLHDGIGRGTFDPTAPFARALSERRELEVRALPTALAQIADRGIALTSANRLVSRSQPEPIGS